MHKGTMSAKKKMKFHSRVFRQAIWCLEIEEHLDKVTGHNMYNSYDYYKIYILCQN
jgi:hypothetical protein